ncbi:Hsp33 family molecular chaperone HslO [Salinicoccus sp. ID82-1]|uniref:Hsp33 family molecular chaperone HslO n=1 Tax=Salinicoccus sp. ID82-1 TaxID=2820269 RepID=UPI001F003B39|nr:Hsp33 family molecular chaperone HslO [Salinicoccus sp. ID82-1]MCG1010718.1 Hsp33 family molecular chaperone HslO [Salinicoccus sp. ID82-1]
MMNIPIRKYLICDNQFRVFAIGKDQTGTFSIEEDIAYASAFTTMLLSQEERITFNFKNENSNCFLYIDSFSQGNCFYRLPLGEASVLGTKLFVTKSKLKNFGASYNSIMQFHEFDILKNISSYYKESEQMELSFIENDKCILMIQPLPFFEETQYHYIMEELNAFQGDEERYLSNEYLVETIQVKVLKQ